jgi:hypothetical protein
VTAAVGGRMEGVMLQLPPSLMWGVPQPASVGIVWPRARAHMYYMPRFYVYVCVYMHIHIHPSIARSVVQSLSLSTRSGPFSPNIVSSIVHI